MPFPQPTDKNEVLRTIQIIAGAMMVGVLTFGAIAAFQMTRGEGDEPGTMLLAPLAAGASLLLLVVCGIVPVSKGGTASASAGSPGETVSKELGLYAAYQTRLIIRYALLEGGAMLNLVAAMLEKQPYSLAIAGLLLAIMGVLFPTRGRVEAFVKAQTEMGAFSDLRDR